MEEQATIEQWREAGRRFGRACGKQAVRNAAKKTPRENWNHITAAMVPAKEAQLRAIGGTDEEIGAFLAAAGAETRVLLDALADAVTAPNRRQRRRARSAKSYASECFEMTAPSFYDLIVT
ncbi:MAG TPA: hypothetical protein VGG11_19175 [Xanthobacteraceae bacterium]|jgi:hypothetical protein